MTRKTTLEELSAVFNHVVLPPNLPGGEDSSLQSIEQDVLHRMIRAIEALYASAKPSWLMALKSLSMSLRLSGIVNARFESSKILSLLQHLQLDQVIVLHIFEQNAGLLIRRAMIDNEDCVIFEAFESSPTSEKVLAAPLALRWNFPGRSAKLPFAEFNNHQFQVCLADFLERATMEKLYALQAQAKKANVSVVEARDTASPALITEMLIPLIEAVGDYYQPPLLRKRVRDDINMKRENIPWRRLPFWLVLRVAAQRHLGLLLGNEQGQLCYKSIMCVMMSELLNNCSRELGFSPQLIALLCAKLSRRMAKLETARTTLSPEVAAVYDPVFNHFSDRTREIIFEAITTLYKRWEVLKKGLARRVSPLPESAPDEALNLSLCNSREYLDLLLNTNLGTESEEIDNLPAILGSTSRKVQEFYQQMSQLVAMEAQATQSEAEDEPQAKPSYVLLASDIQRLISRTKSHRSHPEQMSAMVLAVFTLWMRLDKIVGRLCPLLNDHRPVFDPGLLDVLQIQTLSDMTRLQEIQTYLANRQSASQYASILGPLDENSLAARFAAQSKECRSIALRIQKASVAKELKKIKEWEKFCREYDRNLNDFSTNTCLCYRDEDGELVIKDCNKCLAKRRLKRMNIANHEAFLPEDRVARDTIVFELAIPKYIAVYRDATSRIFCELVHPSRSTPGSSPPVRDLDSCEPFEPFSRNLVHSVSLGSRIKGFEQTHYKWTDGKGPIDRILLPFGARFEMFDQLSKTWIKDFDKPLTLQHICGIGIPHALRAGIMPKIQHPPPNVDGPSSYEIQANQSQCPAKFSANEFYAYQKLIASKTTRWTEILVEMGSSNLNWSSEDTMHLLCQLANQAGPQLPGEPFRAFHVNFKEPVFRQRLEQCIGERLRAISNNWREHRSMEVMITMILRLFTFSIGGSTESSLALLKTAREISLHWTTQIQAEISKARDPANGESSRQPSGYRLHAALLCRRTFVTYAISGGEINEDDLASWVQASMVLQESLLEDVERLNNSLKGMLIRDAKMTYQIEDMLRGSVEMYPTGVTKGILKSWSASMDAITNFSKWSFLPSPNDRWVVATRRNTSRKDELEQVIHFNAFEGYLLVNGTMTGQLPLRIRTDQMVKELFGRQDLATYASSMPGMTHQLAGHWKGQEVHFGTRQSHHKEHVVIRAVNNGAVRELVPREVFTGSPDFDLPMELLHGCAHWLYLETGILEVHKVPKEWFKREDDWIIDVRRRIAMRGQSILVDPRSEIFEDLAGVLEHFEKPEQITVRQVSDGSLCVDLRRLDLSFHVNKNGLLHCKQLKAYIDVDQDAGVWYGLQSKIVLREIETDKRIVIVPFGKISYKRRGIHVSVSIAGDGQYAKYEIDNVLGRLSCAPEPRMLYMQALCHALTSFCLPDTLTGLTGTEMAAQILSSGAAQPWTPLMESEVNHIFKAFEDLPPRREYYPAKLKCVQIVTWNKDLTTTIQHEGFEPLIRKIKETSNRLKMVNPASKEGFTIEDPAHLHQRAMARRQLYERQIDDSHTEPMADLLYIPRDRGGSRRAAKVFTIASLIQSKGSSLIVHRSLESIFDSWEEIGGCRFSKDLSPSPPLVDQIENPINEQWGDLISFCRQFQDPAPLLFRLGLLSFGPHADMDAIQALAALAIVPQLRDVQLPGYTMFTDFEERGPPSAEVLQKLIAPACREFEATNIHEEQDAQGRDVDLHEQACQEEVERLSREILTYWPCLPTGSNLEAQQINIPVALANVQPMWENRSRNTELQAYAREVQDVLTSLSCRTLAASSTTRTLAYWKLEKPVFTTEGHRKIIPVLTQDLVGQAGGSLGELSLCSDFRLTSAHVSKKAGKSKELEKIISEFAQSTDSLRQRYGEDLLHSLAALRALETSEDDYAPLPTKESVEDAIDQSHSAIKEYAEKIRIFLLATHDSKSLWLHLGQLWPSTNPCALLGTLGSSKSLAFAPGLKEALLSYGLAITKLQRSKRILSGLLREDRRAVMEELRNPGHENWTPLEQPDWLLLEIESNFLIRAQQVDVARAIMNPSTGKNSVVQLNMGQGKTSCILPMVAAALANGENLLRLIVPKALLMQTAQTAQSRLGGLLSRQVRQIPFSRGTPTLEGMLESYASLHHEIRDTRGVILTCHENILSFKVGGWQHLVDRNSKAAKQMIEFQGWLDTHCRDILDECDVTLSVKTQLNYPSGIELPVDGHPTRWLAAQGLLALAADHFTDLQAKFPDSIEILKRKGSFPFVQFLQDEVEDVLSQMIVDDICCGRATFLPHTPMASSSQRRSVRQILTEPEFDNEVFSDAVKAFSNPQASSKILLVVRGLLVNKILVLCLGRRWNVQYGLHKERAPMAVPYEAKNRPSARSEFGHPDVAILKTCLAFYYAGLRLDQFTQELQHLLQSDDPGPKYERWTSGCIGLPQELQDWNMINIEDTEQMEKLCKHLRLERLVIDDYLNHSVFPLHARQSEVRLQASAWDIPLLSPNQHDAKTTGFSGTNDNRMLLPLSIQQDHVPGLDHTSAMVLSHLLQKRNRKYHVIEDTTGKRLTEKGLLDQLCEKGIRVLIDAGAYILEMGNRALAQRWLEIDREAKAAVYFGNDNRAWVLFRNTAKRDVSLLSTPFVDDLSECLVYFDEAHTRGVDLKLPATARAALTLALKQTKDYTVQAAMRLRQLSTKQSLTFYAPPAVDRSIRDVCEVDASESIDSRHVVSWLLEQTCRSIEDLQGLYKAQGLDFCSRTDALWRNCDLFAQKANRESLLDVLLQPERRTLEEMYGDGVDDSSDNPESVISDSQLAAFAGQLRVASGTGGPLVDGALQEVEQEREVQLQVQAEQQHQIQKPRKHDALQFPGLHPSIEHFARTGCLKDAASKAPRFQAAFAFIERYARTGCRTGVPPKATGFQHAFAYMATTCIGRKFGVREIESNLFVSMEFVKTVNAWGDEGDNFLRPVEWILWSPTSQTALIIIKEEAEILLSEILASGDQSMVHLLAYAAPITRGMLTFNHLKYYSFPQLPDSYVFPDWLRTEVGIVAGALYIESADWNSWATYLGRDKQPSDLEGDEKEKNTDSEAVGRPSFANEPAAFLLEWLALRHKAQDITHTPVGHLCVGRKYHFTQ